MACWPRFCSTRWTASSWRPRCCRPMWRVVAPEVGVPVVQFNRVSILGGWRATPAARSRPTTTRAGQLVARLLVERGYRRFGFLAGLEDSSTSIERERGYRDALRELGHDVACRDVGHVRLRSGAGRRAADVCRRSAGRAVCRHDHMAIAALDVLRQELGLRVPEDVAVVGFDDVPQAAWGAYRLTTVRQQVEPMVDATVDLLREQMQAELRPRDIVVPCGLVERATVRAGP
ncbi:hypothetical protein CTI14_24420 [Methylobacterium radiotolerans]|nr:hypothetical protein CTI14_24420 [Methylobacterium radiotolerans]